MNSYVSESYFEHLNGIYICVSEIWKKMCSWNFESFKQIASINN